MIRKGLFWRGQDRKEQRRLRPLKGEWEKKAEDGEKRPEENGKPFFEAFRFFPRQ